MRHQTLTPLSRQAAEPRLAQAQPDHQQAELLLRLSLAADACPWKQALFEQHIQHSAEEVQCAAIQALGHLARVAPQAFDRPRALVALTPFAAHATLAGVTEDAWDDITWFVS